MERGGIMFTPRDLRALAKKEKQSEQVSFGRDEYHCSCPGPQWNSKRTKVGTLVAEVAHAHVVSVVVAQNGVVPC